MKTKTPTIKQLDKLAKNAPLLSLNGLHAGYGKMEILHGIDLRVGAGQSLCLIGPNGAGKSTILHSIYGFTNIYSGEVSLNGQNITKVEPNGKLKTAGIAYILQDNSVFPDMTVEENLWMGGYLLSRVEARAAAERVLDETPQLWNVLRGHMSLVGPRPCLFNQMELIQEREARGVYAARPGITGLAQIQGIDMSTPVKLAETDAKMLETLNIISYFHYILMTLAGKGAGDRVKTE